MKSSGKKLLILIPVVVALTAALMFLRSSNILSDYSAESIQAWVNQFSPWSQLAFFGLQLLSVIVAPIPSNITAAAGGIIFGFPQGFLLTITAVVLGSCTTFSLARLLGQNFVQNFVSYRLSVRYLELIQRKRDVFLALTLLFPFFPDDIICILAGLTDIPFRRFLVIVALTRPWGLLAASALGGTALSLPTWAIPIAAVALALLFFLGMKYGDRIESAIVRRFRGK